MNVPSILARSIPILLLTITLSTLSLTSTAEEEPAPDTTIPEAVIGHIGTERIVSNVLTIEMDPSSTVTCSEPTAPIPNTCVELAFDGSQSRDPPAPAGQGIDQYKWFRQGRAANIITTPTANFLFPVGTNNVNLTVIDPSGNEGFREITVLITPPPNDPPVVVITAPQDAASVSGPITIEGTVIDPESQTVLVEINIKDASGNDKVVAPVGTFNTGSQNAWTYTWDTLNVPDGDYTIIIEGTDDADGLGVGMTSASATITVMVANSHGGCCDVSCGPDPDIHEPSSRVSPPPFGTLAAAGGTLALILGLSTMIMMLWSFLHPVSEMNEYPILDGRGPPELVR